ncbi:hypothetical protein D3C87_280300 [compost metagenome]
MTKQEVEAILLLAGIEYKGLFRIANEYSPSNLMDPWWLFITKDNDAIKIGWRKRVINIDWEATSLRINPKETHNIIYEFHKAPITADEVTQEATYVHAYGHGKAVIYLQELKLRLEQNHYAESEVGKKDLAERKEKAERRDTKEAA